jgi:hypothetical protein
VDKSLKKERYRSHLVGAHGNQGNVTDLGMMAPPYYILVSQSSLPPHASGAPSAALSHPIIQYYYADDSPLSLLPQSVDDHVVILDYHPTAPTPAAKSISRNLAVTGLKVAEAPGAAAAEDDLKKNDRMYILETTTGEDRYAVSANLLRNLC